MKKDIFYKWHKSSLEKHTTEVDVDAIWAAIEPEVDAINVSNKKRRRFFFFLFSLSSIIVLTGFIGLFFANPLSTAQHISTDNNITKTQDKEGTQIAETTVETKSLDQISQPSSIESSEKKVDKRNTLPPTTIFSPSSNLKNGDNNEKIRRHHSHASTSQVHLGDESSHTIVESIVIKNTAQKAVTPTIILNEKKSSNQESDFLEKGRTVLPIADQLPSAELGSLIYDEEELPSLKVETKKTPRFQFSIGVYSGLALSNRNLALKNNSEENELLALRETTERNLEVWNNGVKAKLAHKSGLFLNIGLQYSRLAENFRYDTDHLKVDSIANQIIGFSNNLLGDEVSVKGFAPNNTLFELEYDFYNYHHFLDIPVSVGYQKQYKLWNFGARAGVVYNLSLQSKGRILENEYSAIDISDETNSPFINKVPLSYEGGLNLGFRLTKHIELGVEAYYRFLPNSITNDNYSISQKYSWTGLNASINYLF